MTVLIISIVLSVLFYAVLVLLLERYRLTYQSWTQELRIAETEAAKGVRQLPVEFQEDKDWGTKSREISKNFVTMLDQLIVTLGSNGASMKAATLQIKEDGEQALDATEEVLEPVGDAGAEHSEAEVKIAPAKATPFRFQPGLGDPLALHIKERLAVLRELVATHYPFPSAMGQVADGQVQPWPIKISWSLFLGLPVLLSLAGALLVYAANLEATGLLLQVLGWALLGYLLFSLLVWWRREELQRQINDALQCTKNLEQYAAVPFQDRVQLDMSIALMESISEHSASLNSALKEHVQAVDAIPGNISEQVSTQVESGLTPVRQEIEKLREGLTSSYDAMSGALTETAARFVSLADRIGMVDKYQTWSSHLAESSESTRALANTLTKYQAQTEGFYDDLVGLTAKLTESQAKVQGTYEQIAASVAERTLHEELAREEIVNTVREQMGLLLKEQSDFNATTNEMTIQVREGRQLYKTLVEKLPKLIDGISDVTTRLHDTAHAVSSLPTVYRNALATLQEQSGRYADQLGGLLKKVEDQHNSYLSEVQGYAKNLDKSLDQSLGQFSGELDRYLTNMRTYYEDVEESRLSLDEMHRQAINKMTSEVDRYAGQMRDYRKEVEAYRQAFDQAHQEALDGARQEIERLTEALKEYAQQVREPEHWLVKPALFTLLTGILAALVVLVIQG